MLFSRSSVVLTCLALCLLFAVGCKRDASSPTADATRIGTAIGDQAPSFTQNNPAGVPVSLRSFRGKVVLLDFWATWCGPCIAQMPAVKKLWQEYRSKDMVIIGISLDDDAAAWKRYIEKEGIDWVHTGDGRGWDNAVAQTYRVTSIPRTFLIDKNGTIVGMNLSDAQLRTAIDRELQK